MGSNVSFLLEICTCTTRGENLVFVLQNSLFLKPNVVPILLLRMTLVIDASVMYEMHRCWSMWVKYSNFDFMYIEPDTASLMHVYLASSGMEMFSIQAQG